MRLTQMTSGLNRDARLALALPVVSALLSLCWSFGVQAQTLKGIQASSSDPKVGQSVGLVIDYEPREQAANYCGLLVKFGDGEEQQIRIESAQAPLRLTHTYKRPGTYAISVEGTTIFRGLRTAVGCLGTTQSTAINVGRDAPIAEVRSPGETQNSLAPSSPRVHSPIVPSKPTDPLTAYVICMSAAYGELVTKYPSPLEATARSRLACQVPRDSFERDLAGKFGASATEVMQNVDLQIYRNFQTTAR